MEGDGTAFGIDERVDLSRIVSGVDAGLPASLCAFVCYYASHYIAIVHVPHTGQWLHYDDASVSVIGESWSDVRLRCSHLNYLPALLLYRQPEPAATGGGGAAPAEASSS